LPNPVGWDVEIFRVPIADDWQCSETGPVSDIHFWTSWAQDNIGQIGWLNIEIFNDIPDPDPANPQTFSMPGASLWSHKFLASEFTVRPYGTGNQGFYDPPPSPSWSLNDHQQYQQINIVDIVNPFYQEEGKIYWLSISADWEGIQASVGWKTSLNYFNDAAVYWNDVDKVWLPLYDPSLAGSVPLDLAFVITPEPATLILLGLGALALIKRKG
jgi:hypothetical protein